ncbi:hypothetical protein B0H14DRAFT_2828337, partial [Mycena olivaceomarginata]
DNKIAVQETNIAALEQEKSKLWQENSELWQEIHRLKGPRLPLEIFSLIVNSARDDKKALETFSLVCRSWMCITREIVFARIPLDVKQSKVMRWDDKPELLPLLDNPRCTLFPHVRALGICMEDGTYGEYDNSEDDDDGKKPTVTAAAWLDHFLLHIGKFTALSSLKLYINYTVSSGYLDAIAGAMPPTSKEAIRELEIDQPLGVGMSALAFFISHFTNLTTLTCGDLYDVSEYDDDGTDLLDTNEVITKLVFTHSPGQPAHTVLKWFTDLHTGDIESLVAYDLQTKHPVEFRHFIDRFGMSLCELGMSFFIGNDNMVPFWDSPYLVTVKYIRLRFLDHELRRLPNIIAQLPQTVEEITLLLWIDREKCTDDFFATSATWSQLDNTLVGETLPSLRNLRVDTAGRCPEKHAKEVWRLLPRCAEKQILTTQRPKFQLVEYPVFVLENFDTSFRCTINVIGLYLDVLCKCEDAQSNSRRIR